MSNLTHLDRLEADSERPVMLYSVGKDSSVMLHLALKAFYPSRPPFPLLHVDTTWKFCVEHRHVENQGPQAGTRPAQHRWDPKQQRLELWHLYNARI